MAPPRQPASASSHCGFHGPDGAFAPEAALRAAVVAAATAERRKWFDARGKAFHKEQTDARFADLVRYWLAGRTGTIRPGKLEAVQQASLDPRIAYTNLTDAALNAAIQTFRGAEATVSAKNADVYEKSRAADAAAATLRAARAAEKQAAQERTRAAALLNDARRHSGSGAQAAVDRAMADFKSAGLALDAAQKTRVDAGKLLDAATGALKAAMKSHDRAKADRDALKPTAQNWTRAAKQAIRKAILDKAGSTDRQTIDDSVEAALQLAHQSRADIEPWSAVFVVSCVRAAAIDVGLEKIDSRGDHRGIDGLLKASQRHSDYIVEARERKKKGKAGTYHAFEPAARVVQAGDIICADRKDFIGRPKSLKDIVKGDFLHGDIVTRVENERGRPVYAETIGGNVLHTVRGRRYPLNAGGHLIVSADELFAQELEDGTFLPFEVLATIPTMLAPASTGRIFAVLSLVAECKPTAGARPRKDARAKELEWFGSELLETLESPFLEEQLFVEEPKEEWELPAAVIAAESPFQHALERTLESLDSPEMDEPRSLEREDA
jgi:hypothetical protein